MCPIQRGIGSQNDEAKNSRSEETEADAVKDHSEEESSKSAAS